ncbi:MAG: putative metal-binding motif-containing protein [Nannocystaceae bacterium]
MKRAGVAALALILPLACNSDATEPSSLRARSAADPNSDVGGVHYTITRCDDDSVVAEADRLVDDDQTVPGNAVDLADSPLDSGSAHLFADLFEVLPAGCYNVAVQPVRDDGTPSEVCVGAHKDDVLVEQAQTTEIFLLMQCEGVDPGALDAIAAFNHEPDLDDVEFDDSKFECGSVERVCLTGSDVDGDPLEFELTAADDCEVEMSGDPEGDNSFEGITQCFTVTCHDWGRADLRARVYDLAWNEDGVTRIEDWLLAEGYPSESHAELNFWAYFDGEKFYADADADGYGDAGSDATLVCEGDEPPDGYTTDNTDCNDAEATVHPGAEEICDDGFDNDCSGDEDEVCAVSITADGVAYGHHGQCLGWNACGDAATCALWACSQEGYDTVASFGESRPCTQWNNCHLFYTPQPGGGIQYNWGNWCDVMGVSEIMCSDPSGNARSDAPPADAYCADEGKDLETCSAFQ